MQEQDVISALRHRLEPHVGMHHLFNIWAASGASANVTAKLVTDGKWPEVRREFGARDFLFTYVEREPNLKGLHTFRIQLAGLAGFESYLRQFGELSEAEKRLIDTVAHLRANIWELQDVHGMVIDQ